jgi:hypothetical protein
VSKEDLRKDDVVQPIEKNETITDQPLSDDELKPVTGGTISETGQAVATCLF